MTGGAWVGATAAVAAVVAVWCGWRVFVTQSMVRASYLLLASFLGVAVIVLLLGAEYLGYALVFMMAVEMVVMALFMVMFMMNPAGLNPMRMVHQPRVAAVAGGALFVVLAFLALFADWPEHDARATDRAHATVALGRELMGGSMLVFETAGVTILATMLAAVVLSTRRGRFGDDVRSMPPSIVPDGGARAAVDDAQPSGQGAG
jgi:NADH:ubiquinone oxidoreductase subunit 6 (subunit J)